MFISKEKVKNLEVTPVKKLPALTTETAQEKCPEPIPAHHPSAPSPLTPCSGTPGTQALQDLMELAEEGMTLTQYGYTTNATTGEMCQMLLAHDKITNNAMQTSHNRGPFDTS